MQRQSLQIINTLKIKFLKIVKLSNVKMISALDLSNSYEYNRFLRLNRTLFAFLIEICEEKNKNTKENSKRLLCDHACIKIILIKIFPFSLK
jgi:hypothetical protein